MSGPPPPGAPRATPDPAPESRPDEVFEVPLAALGGKVTREQLRRALAAAAGTPSAANLQPWMFTVLNADGRARAAGHALDALGRRRPNHRDAALAAAPALVLACMDVARASCRFGPRGAELFGVQDVAVAVHRVRVAAWRAGLASSWVREVDLDALARELALAPRFAAQALLAFGRAEVAALERPPALTPADFVRWQESEPETERGNEREEGSR